MVYFSRFDSELSAVQEELEREQKLREKLNRSSELEQTSKLTLSKQLEEEEEARLDLEKQVKRLKEELDDASSLGNKDEMEVKLIAVYVDGVAINFYCEYMPCLFTWEWNEFLLSARCLN